MQNSSAGASSLIQLKVGRRKFRKIASVRSVVGSKMRTCRSRLRALARELDPSLAEGVYAWLRGPHYESAAEAEWVRRVGADMLGMSTVPEAIAARESGMELLGFSTVTAIEGAGGIDPSEVVAVAEATAARMGPLLAQVVTKGAQA
jgi:purine-nucleoside phosphorylase